MQPRVDQLRGLFEQLAAQMGERSGDCKKRLACLIRSVKPGAHGPEHTPPTSTSAIPDAELMAWISVIVWKVNFPTYKMSPGRAK